MIEKSCMNYDGDRDCNKCCKNGYIYDCPADCPDYVDFFGHKKTDCNGEKDGLD